MRPGVFVLWRNPTRSWLVDRTYWTAALEQKISGLYMLGPTTENFLYYLRLVFIDRDLYFGPKTIFIPPPSENDIFPPSCDTVFFFYSHRAFLPILQLFYPFTSPFLIFFPLSFFFLYIFPLFLFAFSYFFPQMTSAYIPPQGGQVFSNI